MLDPARSHGPTWRVWANMHSRCRNPNVASFRYYGARGITVCAQWKAFRAFFADMGEVPEGMTLDRIDPNGNYEPSNCRWASARDQANNRRSNRLMEFRGERKTAAEWARQMGMRPQTLIQRLRYGWSDERAISEPINTAFGRRTRHA